jgi:HlyD family secretion protein
MLRPGMTATASITVQEIEGATLIPNAALRFVPPKTEESETSNGSLLEKILPHPPRSPAKTKTEMNPSKSEQVIWMLRDNQPVSVPVAIGATDGSMTEVVKGNITAGTKVIVDTVEDSR